MLHCGTAGAQERRAPAEARGHARGGRPERERLRRPHRFVLVWSSGCTRQHRHTTKGASRFPLPASRPPTVGSTMQHGTPCHDDAPRSGSQPEMCCCGCAMQRCTWRWSAEGPRPPGHSCSWAPVWTRGTGARLLCGLLADPLPMQNHDDCWRTAYVLCTRKRCALQPHSAYLLCWRALLLFTRVSHCVTCGCSWGKTPLEATEDAGLRDIVLQAAGRAQNASC